jgi:hypothetical protein
LKVASMRTNTREIANRDRNDCRVIPTGLLAKLGIDSYDCRAIAAISARKSFKGRNRGGI